MTGMQTEINEHGPAVSSEEAQEFQRRLEFLMEYATAVVFAGSLPANLDESFLVAALRKAREEGLYTVVDAPPTVLKAGLKAEPSLVSPNQHEAESAVGFDFIEGEDFLRGIGRLIELGAERACVTSPSGHSYLAVEGGVILASAPEVEGLSTIGSGDAYLAGMLAGFLHRKLSPIEAVRLAAGCAAANAETLGAGVFEARRAEELAEEVRAEFITGDSDQASAFSFQRRQD
jgi:1-phosphofructokinase/tagatose 6-phosphate kinase